jgi:hypothetical protein
MKTSVTVVIGTHKETPVPKEIKRLGLLERFALVQHTARDDKTYMYFDSDIAVKLLEALEKVLSVQARVTYRDQVTDVRWLANLYSLEQDEEERDPFEQAELYVNTKLICLVVTEGWTAVGGPKIYHDSHTYSVYSANDLSEKLLEALSEFGIVPGKLYRTRRLAEGRLESAEKI